MTVVVEGFEGLVEDEALLHPFDWIFSFFFIPSLNFSPDLTCRTFDSFKLAGRTQLQKRPGNTKTYRTNVTNCCKFQSQYKEQHETLVTLSLRKLLDRAHELCHTLNYAGEAKIFIRSGIESPWLCYDRRFVCELAIVLDETLTTSRMLGDQNLSIRIDLTESSKSVDPARDWFSDQLYTCIVAKVVAIFCYEMISVPRVLFS